MYSLINLISWIILHTELTKKLILCAVLDGIKAFILNFIRSDCF